MDEFQPVETFINSFVEFLCVRVWVMRFVGFFKFSCAMGFCAMRDLVDVGSLVKSVSSDLYVVGLGSLGGKLSSELCSLDGWCIGFREEVF